MKRIIAWFVENAVATNLLMAVLVVGGLISLASIRQEVHDLFCDSSTAANRAVSPAYGKKVGRGAEPRVGEGDAAVVGSGKLTSQKSVPSVMVS